MTNRTCAHCGAEQPAPPPPEPPVGTWVRDRHGGVSIRNTDGWAPSPTGFYGCGKWAAMWDARGPLIECPAWGIETTDDASGRS